MRFLQLVPGTGHYYCGSCLRDDTLGRGLRALGHEVVVAPLYLPLVLEQQVAADPAGDDRVHLGGINMYLQQKSRLFRYLPRFLADLLDKPGLLRWAARRGNLTEAPDLGAMAVSMLQGECGRQAKELDKLVAWASGLASPDVVVLSNIMLGGTVRRLKQALDRPCVATLQGEAPFLDALPPPASEKAWQILRERAASIDAFVAVSRSYGDLMRARLGLAPERVHVVYNGIDTADFQAEPRPASERRPPTIGYLARMCRDKGLPTLVDAFGILKQRSWSRGLRLRVAGTMLNEDRPLVGELTERLRARGLAADVDFLPNITRAQKLDFLGTLSALSVPATYGESFGLYLLEAMVAGVPVVQPRHAAFPEILAVTGGGLLCEPDDPASLAEALEQVLRDDETSRELARAGRRSVLERFTQERMAGEFVAVCRMAASARDAPPSPSPAIARSRTEVIEPKE